MAAHGILASLLVLAVLTAPSTSEAEFTGEILVAKPPANWNAGPLRKDDGVRARTWFRGFPTNRDWREEVTISTFEDRPNGDPGERAEELGADLSGGCGESRVETTGTVRGEGYVYALVRVLCTAPSKNAEVATGKAGKPAESIFVAVKVLSGEYARYEIVRRWAGPKDDPRLPTNSPKVMAQWEEYFRSSRVCNTLVTDCDAYVAPPYSNPRFLIMKTLPVKERPVHDQEALLVGVERFGRLTGRAEACGEDTGALLAKINKMLSSVTANDRDASEAVMAFRNARDEGRAADEAADACGEARRRFRSHPSRVSAFYRFIEDFFD